MSSYCDLELAFSITFKWVTHATNNFQHCTNFSSLSISLSNLISAGMLVWVASRSLQSRNNSRAHRGNYSVLLILTHSSPWQNKCRNGIMVLRQWELCCAWHLKRASERETLMAPNSIILQPRVVSQERLKPAYCMYGRTRFYSVVNCASQSALKRLWN